MQRKSCLVIFILIFFILNTVSSNTIDSLELRLQKEEGLPRMDMLVELATLCTDNDPAKSFKYASEVIEWAKENNNRKKEAEGIFLKGKVYFKQSNYDLSLNYHFSALKIFEELNDSNQIILVINSIGIVYNSGQEYDKALDYFNKAYILRQKTKDEKGITSSLNNFGAVHCHIGNYDTAMCFYHQALERTIKAGNSLNIGRCLNNIGYNYYYMGESENALKYYNRALEKYKETGNVVVIARAYTNVGMAYLELKDYKKSEYYFSKSDRIAHKHSFKNISLSNNFGLNLVYDSVGNSVKALHHLRIHGAIKDSLFNAKKQKQLYELEKIYLIEKKEKELERVNLELAQEKIISQKQMVQKYALIGGLFFVLFFFFIIFRNYKEKEKASITQEKLLTIELENNKLKEQQLKTELTFKNKELTDFALHIVQRNDLLKNLKTIAQKIKTNFGKDKGKEFVSTLMNLINYYININKETEELQSRVDKVNQDFLINLEEKYPKLTPNERRLSCLLRLNLSSKEIGDLLNVGTNSVDTYRYNLRKKFNLSADDKLSDFLKNL